MEAFRYEAIIGPKREKRRVAGGSHVEMLLDGTADDVMQLQFRYEQPSRRR
jgi:hypothetical protein